jgi:putative colanic acid biosynthesis acetyltransferase WcaF
MTSVQRTLPQLDKFKNPEFVRGRSRFVEALWLLVQWLFVSSWIPGAAHRRWLLRAFGARIGDNVEIKPRITVKFPWRLEVGDNSWLGESVWIDNLALVKIGAHCCISQEVYLCTGSHDWSLPSFDLVTRGVIINDGAWLAARSAVAPGVTVGEGAVLGFCSVAIGDLDPWKIYLGAPAIEIRDRNIVTRATSDC